MPNGVLENAAEWNYTSLQHTQERGILNCRVGTVVADAKEHFHAATRAKASCE